MADQTLRATLAGVLLFAIGIAIGGGAIVNYQRERANLEGWQRADGEVLYFLTGPDGKPRPQIGFSAGGERFRFTGVGALANRAYKVGDHVEVLYPADDPRAARLESPAIRWGRTLYAGAGAILLMALGGYLAWYSRTRGLTATPQLPNSTTPK